MNFIDDRLLSGAVSLFKLELSHVLLKNEQQFPWLVLVPEVPNVTELFELNDNQRQTLMNEIDYVSRMLYELYQPTKLNIGALGNIVSQLHVHVVARYRDDPLWPHGIWQPSFINKPYQEVELADNIKKLQAYFNNRLQCRANASNFQI